MRRLIDIVENAASPFDEAAILKNLQASDGMDHARIEFRLEQGRDPYDDEDEDEDTFRAWYLDWSRSRIREKYYEIKWLIKDGRIRLYRVITAPENWKPDPNRHPGICWSWETEAAQAHWGDYTNGNVEWMITADVAEQYIDWETTLSMNADYDYEEEKEIRILPNSPVDIVSVVRARE